MTGAAYIVLTAVIIRTDLATRLLKGQSNGKDPESDIPEFTPTPEQQLTNAERDLWPMRDPSETA